MKNLHSLLMAVFITGCCSIPPTSELVLMAEANPDRNNKHNKMIEFSCLDDQETSQRNEIFEKLIDEALKGQTGLNKEERKKALKLLTSGKFKSDLHDLVILTVSIAPKAVTASIGSIKTLEEIPKDLHVCLTSGKCENPTKIHDVVNKLYEDPSVTLQRETFVALLNNESFRLALIVYAHSNGIDIDNEDLNFVQGQLQKKQFDTDELVDEGIERLKAKYKIDEVEARIKCLEKQV